MRIPRVKSKLYPSEAFGGPWHGQKIMVPAGGTMIFCVKSNGQWRGRYDINGEWRPV